MKGKKVRSSASVVVSHIILALWCGFTVFCLLWILVTSLKSNRQLFQNVWNLPVKLHLENYAKIWNIFNLRTYFLNSLLIVPTSVLLILVFGAPAAYVLSRAEFKGRELVLNFFTIGWECPSSSC